MSGILKLVARLVINAVLLGLPEILAARTRSQAKDQAIKVMVRAIENGVVGNSSVEGSVKNLVKTGLNTAESKINEKASEYIERYL